MIERTETVMEKQHHPTLRDGRSTAKKGAGSARSANYVPAARPYECTRRIVFADGGITELKRWLASHGKTGEGRDAYKRLETGWQEGADKINRKMASPSLFKTRTPKWGYDVAGDLPDVGRYLAGQPANMRSLKRTSGAAPYVALYIANGVRGTVSGKQFENFGIAVCEIIDSIENSGTRVELNQLTKAFTSGAADWIITGWRVKNSGEPLDMAQVAFTYMDPDAHRVIQFNMRSAAKVDIGGSGGITAADFPDAPHNAAIVDGVGAAGGQCDTLDGARRYLAAQINKATGTETITKDMLAEILDRK
jgi:hypothetical protein